VAVIFDPVGGTAPCTISKDDGGNSILSLYFKYGVGRSGILQACYKCPLSTVDGYSNYTFHVVGHASSAFHASARSKRLLCRWNRAFLLPFGAPPPAPCIPAMATVAAMPPDVRGEGSVHRAIEASWRKFFTSPDRVTEPLCSFVREQRVDDPRTSARAIRRRHSEMGPEGQIRTKVRAGSDPLRLMKGH
jgi:hypothetical protein